MSEQQTPALGEQRVVPEGQGWQLEEFDGRQWVPIAGGVEAVSEPQQEETP